MKLDRVTLAGCLLIMVMLITSFSGGCTGSPKTSNKPGSSPSPQASPGVTLPPALLKLDPIVVQDEVLYQDDFSDFQSGWRTRSEEDIDAAYESGVYSLRGKCMSMIPDLNYADFAVEVDASVIAEGDTGFWGIVFRSQDEGNDYVFMVNDINIYLFKSINGISQSLAFQTKVEDFLASPDANRLKVVCLGSQIDLYVNDQLLGSVKDSAFASGKIGLVTTGNNPHVHFDNLAVYAVAAPGTSTLYPIYQDDFDNAGNDWWTGSNGSMEGCFESGEYSLLYHKSGWSWSTVPCSELTDFDLEVDTHVFVPEHNGWWGLIFRQIDDKHYYAFFITDISFVLIKQSDSETQVLSKWQDSGTLNGRCESNRLKVVCQGSRIELYINGQRVDSLTDNSYSSGKIGLAIAQPNTHAHFDNLKVYAVKNGGESVSIPAAARTIYAKAVQYRKSGNPAKAVEYYEKAVQSYYRYPDAWEEKGEVLMETHRFEEALACFQSAAEIEPDNSEIWVEEGRCLEELGDDNAAMSCYNKALEVDPQNTEAKEARDILIASGVPDNKQAPPAKQYDTKNPLVVNPSVLIIKINEGEPFSNGLNVKNGQGPYHWYVISDNGTAVNINVSPVGEDVTAKVSGRGVMIDSSSKYTASRIGEIEIGVEDSSPLVRKGKTSFRLEVINNTDEITPTPAPTTPAATAPLAQDGAAVAAQIAREWYQSMHGELNKQLQQAAAGLGTAGATASYSNPSRLSNGTYQVTVTPQIKISAGGQTVIVKLEVVLIIDVNARKVIKETYGEVEVVY